MEDLGPTGIAMYGGGGCGLCLTSLILLSNLLALFRYAGGEGDEAASPGSLTAWGLTVVSFFLGPCGFITALIGFVMARIERGGRDAHGPFAQLCYQHGIATDEPFANDDEPSRQRVKGA